jgi:glycosyltransferase involved in cell wall biosynthesis
MAGRSHLDERLRNYRFFNNARSVVAGMVESFKPDVIYARGARAALFVPPDVRTTFVVDLVDSLELLYLRESASANTISPRKAMLSEARALGRLQRELVERSSVSLLISQPDLEQVAATAGNARLRVQPNGVDIEYFSRHLGATREELVVFFGVLDYLPNDDAAQYLVEDVFPALKEELPGLQLKLIGPNPSNSLKDAAARNGAEVCGFVDDLRPLLAEALAFVCPMRKGAGMKNKILVAMSMGLPVVATELAMDGIAATEGVHYLKGETPAEISAQVRRLADDPGLAERLGKSGRELVETNYSWDAISERLDRLIGAAISGDIAAVK